MHSEQVLHQLNYTYSLIIFYIKMPFFDLLPLSVPLNRKISFISLVQICHPSLLPLSFLKPRDTDVHNCFTLHSSGLSLHWTWLTRPRGSFFKDDCASSSRIQSITWGSQGRTNHIHSHEQTEEKPYFLSREKHLVAAWALFFTLIGSGPLV